MFPVYDLIKELLYECHTTRGDGTYRTRWREVCQGTRAVHVLGSLTTACVVISLSTRSIENGYPWKTSITAEGSVTSVQSR